MTLKILLDAHIYEAPLISYVTAIKPTTVRAPFPF